MFGAISAAIGGAGVVGNYFAGREANRTNVDIANRATMTNTVEAQKNRDFQRDEARQQQAFQTNMSNTSMQRSANDMKNAGFNPLLAMTQGASTPGGAAGSGSQASAQSTTVENPLDSAISSALEVTSMAQAIKKQKQEITNMKSANLKIQDESALAKAMRKNTEVNTKSTQQNITIKGPVQRGSGVINYLYDQLGTKPLNNRYQKHRIKPGTKTKRKH